MNQTFPLELSSHTTAQRIAFIQGHWHGDIVNQAYTSFIEEVEKNGMSADQVEVFTVSGAYEIPLQAKVLAQSGRFGAIVGAGFVVDGGIYRHDFVAHAVIDGMMRVQLDTGVPILSVVLTPHHFHEHTTHHDFYFEHFVAKGREAASACLNTIENLHRARKLSEA
ncbi:6,7-dimethyl-8-ribityllumazine synthase [Halomonas sp. GD1P12]|uniref:6,7-dimethyl-8-ribityllumazine synthase n=1 Tax=Halomonas sp. GD1P12 TaxID=2982691 RepID=UPI0021E512E5|nr:6,7-dimethyl-8-ribityllumazine synthase [Halomonas sp. GD1P12]UYG00333.1 6,7-dimethyl-8-ribityllumazine synthase [Halomonas sp. GD1P12]